MCVHACVRVRACACVRACVRVRACVCVTGGGLAHWRMKILEINRSYISPRQDCLEHNIVSRINFPKVMHSLRCGIDLAAGETRTKQPIHSSRMCSDYCKQLPCSECMLLIHPAHTIHRPLFTFQATLTATPVLPPE